MKQYDTNLASEYYILATLYRLGHDAYITLGDKKAIDIILNLNGKKQLTIDVKGLRGTTLFPTDNLDERENKPNHFIVFISFLNKIEDLSIIPEIYILPHNKIKDMIYKNPKGTRKGVRLSTLRSQGKKYQNNWEILR